MFQKRALSGSVQSDEAIQRIVQKVRLNLRLQCSIFRISLSEYRAKFTVDQLP